MEKVENMGDLVKYQNGSVVSNTLINKNNGTVTLFSFDAGQGLSEHTSPFDAMAYILDGEVEITIAGAPYSLKQGEMLVMPATKSHALKAITKFKMLLIMIKS